MDGHILKLNTLKRFTNLIFAHVLLKKTLAFMISKKQPKKNSCGASAVSPSGNVPPFAKILAQRAAGVTLWSGMAASLG